MSAVQARGLGVATLGRWFGLVAGLAASSWLVSSGDSVFVLLFLGPALGIPLLGGVLVGALLRPAPERGPERRALLETRRLGTYLPPWTRLVRGLAAGYVGLTVLGVLMDRPGTDAEGRTVLYTCDDGFGLSWLQAPSAYTIPALTLVLIGLGAAVGALHLLVRRPRPAGVDVADDDRARTEAAAAVVAACAVLVAVPLAGLSLLAASSLSQRCSGPLGELAAVVLLLVTALATAVGCWALWSLLVPRGRA
ncbi:MAG TPA: hypothetical protein VI357_09945 [Mycobacteriales bacterium]